MRPDRAGTACAACVPLILLSALASAPPAVAARGQTVSLSAGVASYYDDNILQYSKEQLATFDTTASPAQFSIRKRDDLVWNPYVGLSWELPGGRGRRHGLRIRGEGDFHQENGTADFRSMSVGWREWFPGERRLALSYYVLPHYYLRQLLNLDDP